MTQKLDDWLAGLVQGQQGRCYCGDQSHQCDPCQPWEETISNALPLLVKMVKYLQESYNTNNYPRRCEELLQRILDKSEAGE